MKLSNLEWQLLPPRAKDHITETPKSDLKVLFYIAGMNCPAKIQEASELELIWNPPLHGQAFKVTEGSIQTSKVENQPRVLQPTTIMI